MRGCIERAADCRARPCVPENLKIQSASLPLLPLRDAVVALIARVAKSLK